MAGYNIKAGLICEDKEGPKAMRYEEMMALIRCKTESDISVIKSTFLAIIFHSLYLTLRVSTPVKYRSETVINLIGIWNPFKKWNERFVSYCVKVLKAHM